MKMDSKKAEFLMASVSLAWGSSYLLMKVGLDSIGPFNLIALRFGIAFICMVLISLPRFHALKANYPLIVALVRDTAKHRLAPVL